MQWHSRGVRGRCRLANLSPESAAVVLDADKARDIGRTVSLTMLLEDGVEWLVASRARVLRRRSLPDGQVGVVVERCGDAICE